MLLALVGNQNCGKTALFNRLTGADQRVGNFPGVTVERKSGAVRAAAGCMAVDLPGLYAMQGYSAEEDVTRRFLREETPDCIINLVDATNLARNLYLTLQLLELRIPMVLALNMMDEVRANGGAVRTETLAKALGVPVVPISAKRNEGVDELLHAALSVARERRLPKPAVQTAGWNAAERYTYLDRLCARAVTAGRRRQHSRSVRIDRVLTNRVAGLPIFFCVMALIFWQTFHGLGAFLQRLMTLGIDRLSAAADAALRGANPVLRSLLLDGVFAGVGTVLSFLPVIVVLFFFLSVLEDTGYLARVAFLTDKLFAGLGLTGRSAAPLLLGFGCTVPAALAARGLPTARERRVTLLLTPFMSCSAKLPIYAAFCAAFFPRHAALVMGLLYLGGIAAGVLFALLVKEKTPAPFLLELPNYRLPSLKSVGKLLWGRAREFLTRAFTVILPASILIWVLRSFDTALHFGAEESMLSSTARLLAPLFAPLGFGDWRAVSALIAGFGAKEAVIGTLGVLLGQLPAGLQTLFTPASALSFLTFTLLYTPCIAAVSTIGHELGGKRLRGVAVALFQCALAWLAAALVYLIAKRLPL